MINYLDSMGDEIKEGMTIYSCEVVYLVIKKKDELYAANLELELPLELMNTRRFRIRQEAENGKES